MLHLFKLQNTLICRVLKLHLMYPGNTKCFFAYILLIIILVFFNVCL